MHDPTRSIRGGAAGVTTPATPPPGSQVGERHHPSDPHHDPARVPPGFNANPPPGPFHRDRQRFGG